MDNCLLDTCWCDFFGSINHYVNTMSDAFCYIVATCKKKIVAMKHILSDMIDLAAFRRALDLGSDLGIHGSRIHFEISGNFANLF